MFQGDLVEFASGYIIKAAVADAGLMVFAGHTFTDQTTGKPTFKNFYAGNDLDVDSECFVYDDPYQVYEAQGDSATAPTQAMVGLYMDSVKTHAGNSTTGISGDELDVSTNSTTLTGAKVLGFAQTPDNEIATHAVLRCFIADAVHIN